MEEKESTQTKMEEKESTQTKTDEKNTAESKVVNQNTTQTISDEKKDKFDKIFKFPAKIADGLLSLMIRSLSWLFLILIVTAFIWTLFYLFNDEKIDSKNGFALIFLWILIVCYSGHIYSIHSVFTGSWSNFKKEYNKDQKIYKILIFGYVFLTVVIPFTLSIVFDFDQLKEKDDFFNHIPSIILLCYRAMVITLITIVLSVTFSVPTSNSSEDRNLRQYLLGAFGIDFISLIILSIFVDINAVIKKADAFDPVIIFLFASIIVLSLFSSVEAVLITYFQKKTNESKQQS